MAGCLSEETAEVLNLSAITVKRDWIGGKGLVERPTARDRYEVRLRHGLPWLLRSGTKYWSCFTRRSRQLRKARTTLLDQACGAGSAIRKAVEELLREHDSAGSFLSSPVWDAAQTALRAELLAPGSRFESFILKQVLGRGGMGEVWSAHDLELDRPVALKFLAAYTASDMDASRIVSEAQSASALNHPNIVTIHGVVRSRGIAAIVMELVAGSSLATLRNAAVALEKVLSIGSQMAQALAAAHAHGIVHGDIKPENIVLRHDGYVKVLDFGLAHRVIEAGLSAAPHPVFGTMRYMSPGTGSW